MNGASCSAEAATRRPSRDEADSSNGAGRTTFSQLYLLLINFILLFNSIYVNYNTQTDQSHPKDE